MLKKFLEFVFVVITLITIVEFLGYLLTKDISCLVNGSYLMLIDLLALKVTDIFHMDLFKRI